MRTLQLHDIAAYLPYQLQFTDGTHKPRWTLMPANIAIFNYDYHKPLLLPLSALTTAQWDEIFQAGLNNAVPQLDFSGNKFFYIEFHDKAAEYIVSDNEGTFSIVYTWDEKSFSSDIRFNQLVACQKIFELHGDLFGLLEDGLALDKREYEPLKNK